MIAKQFFFFSCLCLGKEIPVMLNYDKSKILAKNSCLFSFKNSRTCSAQEGIEIIQINKKFQSFAFFLIKSTSYQNVFIIFYLNYYFRKELQTYLIYHGTAPSKSLHIFCSRQIKYFPTFFLNYFSLDECICVLKA